jgi:translation initiation factor IF-2
MRIYEFAKQKDVSSKELVQLLETEGFAVTSHMSIMTQEMEAFLEKYFNAQVKKQAESKEKKKKPVQKVTIEDQVKTSKKKEPVNIKQVLGSDASLVPKKNENIVSNTKKYYEEQVTKSVPVFSQNTKEHAEAPLSSLDSTVKSEYKNPEQDIFASDNPDIINLLESASEFDNSRSRNLQPLKPSLVRTLGQVKGVGEERTTRRRSRKSYQRRQERAQKEHVAAPKVVTEIKLQGDLVLEEVAILLGKQAGELIISLLKKGMACTKNYLLSEAIIADLAHQYGIKVISDRSNAEKTTGHIRQTVTQSGVDRWPIVVVVGHVDHGKTTFLDYIRKANVAGKEKGGITQHIGAYEVESTHGKMVFLDTPGHEAFSFLRARGIKVTDIAVLMVAADDGVMPQTIEAIKAAREANVAIIVAINKIDKVASTAAIESVKRELAQHDLLVEDWGGNIICAPISAKTGQGIPELLEMITLQAQMMDLKADPHAKPKAFVLESRLDKGYGPVATVILVEGTLKIGDYFYAGETTGKVRLLLKSNGERVLEIGPSVPVQVVGFDKFAPLGEWLTVIDAAEYAKIKAGKTSVAAIATSALLTPAYQENQDKDERIIRIIIKVDTHGTSEAINRIIASLAKQNKEVARRLQIINVSIGDISERDILFAENVGAQVIGLHVKVEKNAQLIAKDKKIDIVLYDVIYHMTEGLEALIQDSRKAIIVSTKVGEAVVRKVFPLKNNTAIAGCYVTEGLFSRNAKVVCMRNNKKIGEGKISSLQRDKKVVKEVHSGYECGFLTEQFHDWQEGDIVQCFVETKEMPK